MTCHPAKPFVFSVRGRYVEMFRAGTKTFELRTRRPAIKAGELHLLYQTAPLARVVAEVRIGEIIDDDPETVWDELAGRGGVSRDEFDLYFSHPCSSCRGRGIDPRAPRGARAIDYGCEPCEGSGAGEPRTRAVAIEMDPRWLSQPIPLPSGMVAPQSWARWRGDWPL